MLQHWPSSSIIKLKVNFVAMARFRSVVSQAVPNSSSSGVAHPSVPQTLACTTSTRLADADQVLPQVLTSLVSRSFYQPGQHRKERQTQLQSFCSAASSSLHKLWEQKTSRRSLLDQLTHASPGCQTAPAHLSRSKTMSFKNCWPQRQGEATVERMRLCRAV